MKLRAALLVLALLPAGSTAALAATKAPVKAKVKPVCNLVQDPTGDAAVEGVPGDGNEDIVSADAASSATTLTTVIRTAALAQPDPEAPLGQAFMFFFNAKGSDRLWYTAVTTYPQGTAYQWGYREAGTGGLNNNYVLGTGTGTVDTAKKEVRMSVPLAAIRAAGPKLAAGTKLGGLTVETRRVLGQGVVDGQVAGGEYVPAGGSRLLFDDASGNSYTLGAPSCVKPGA